jgi:hypothetical protein
MEYEDAEVCNIEKRCNLQGGSVAKRKTLGDAELVQKVISDYRVLEVCRKELFVNICVF